MEAPELHAIRQALIPEQAAGYHRQVGCFSEQVWRNTQSDSASARRSRPGVVFVRAKGVGGAVYEACGAPSEDDHDRVQEQAGACSGLVKRVYRGNIGGWGNGALFSDSKLQLVRVDSMGLAREKCSRRQVAGTNERDGRYRPFCNYLALPPAKHFSPHRTPSAAQSVTYLKSNLCVSLCSTRCSLCYCCFKRADTVF